MVVPMDQSVRSARSESQYAPSQPNTAADDLTDISWLRTYKITLPASLCNTDAGIAVPVLSDVCGFLPCNIFRILDLKGPKCADEIFCLLDQLYPQSLYANDCYTRVLASVTITLSERSIFNQLADDGSSLCSLGKFAVRDDVSKRYRKRCRATHAARDHTCLFAVLSDVDPAHLKRCDATSTSPLSLLRCIPERRSLLSEDRKRKQRKRRRAPYDPQPKTEHAMSQPTMLTSPPRSTAPNAAATSSELSLMPLPHVMQPNALTFLVVNLINK